MKKFLAAMMLTTLITATPVQATEDVDLSMMTKIREEGMRHSQVKPILEHLTGKIGARLSGSPAMKEANEWTLAKMQEFGLENGYLEAFDFGRGWESDYALAIMTSPYRRQLHAVSENWHPGTDGAIEGDVTTVNIQSAADFERYRGKLKGKIVMVAEPPRIKDPDVNRPVFHIHDEDTLSKLENYRIRLNNLELGDRNALEQDLKSFLQYILFPLKLYEFLKEEGAVAEVAFATQRAGSFNSDESFYRVGMTPALPKILITQENYNLLYGAIRAGDPVRLKLDISNRFLDEDHNQYNTIAEIPGKGRKPEIVLAGAHLDSMRLGTGAADNAAGVAIMMEAVRILKALDVKPKRSIRVALWGAEEQGLIGSRNHVQKNYARFGILGEKEFGKLNPMDRLDTETDPEILPDHKRVSVYFNLDNGAGKIRGIYGENNLEAMEIFKEWFKPFHDFGAKTVIAQETGGTDHRSFQSAGIPGYQFIQDRRHYFSLIQHSERDTIDHVNEMDLKQASIIMAAFLYNAAMREERMPRKPRMK